MASWVGVIYFYAGVKLFYTSSHCELQSLVHVNTFFINRGTLITGQAIVTSIKVVLRKYCL